MEHIIFNNSYIDSLTLRNLVITNKAFNSAISIEDLEGTMYADYYECNPDFVMNFEHKTKMNFYEAITSSNINMFILLDMIRLNNVVWMPGLFKESDNKRAIEITISLLCVLDELIIIVASDIIDSYISYKFYKI